MTDFAKRFRCGFRNALSDQGDDHWNVTPNGDRTCSYCGSLSEEYFIDICKHYADGDYDYHFLLTDKSYKRYASRPGVSNASQGGIKFYGVHSDLLSPQVAENCAIYDLAVARYKVEWAKRWKTESPAP